MINGKRTGYYKFLEIESTIAYIKKKSVGELKLNDELNSQGKDQRFGN